MSITKQRQQSAYLALAEAFGYTSVMQGPRIEKVIVSTGVGKKRDKKQIELIENRLAKITGQKVSPRAAPLHRFLQGARRRHSRLAGHARGAHMYDFIDKVIHIALPRTRDFRGLSVKSIDDMGNMTIGLKDNTIFP